VGDAEDGHGRAGDSATPYITHVSAFLHIWFGFHFHFRFNSKLPMHHRRAIISCPMNYPSHVLFGIIRLLPGIVNIAIPDFEFDAYALMSNWVNSQFSYPQTSYVLPIYSY
jgi:hypothetical protein